MHSNTQIFSTTVYSHVQVLFVLIFVLATVFAIMLVIAFIELTYHHHAL